MIKEVKWRGKRWIYGDRPTSEEINNLAENYNIHPVVVEELSHATLRPKVDRFQNFLYLILHFPVFNPETKTSLGAEIDFIIGKDFLITISYEENEALSGFFSDLKKNQEETERIFSSGIEMVFYQLLSRLYDFAMRELDHIKLKIDAIDARLAAREDEATIQEIFFLRRDILNFRRAIKPHETTVNSLEIHGTNFFGKEIQPYFKDIIGEYSKVWNMLENHKETIETLYDTNISFLSMRSNEIMKRLTLMAFVTFPLTLIAAIFSMNITPDSFLGPPYDFLIILGVIVISILSMLTFFKHPKWFLESIIF